MPALGASMGTSALWIMKMQRRYRVALGFVAFISSNLSSLSFHFWIATVAFTTSILTVIRLARRKPSSIQISACTEVECRVGVWNFCLFLQHCTKTTNERWNAFVTLPFHRAVSYTLEGRRDLSLNPPHSKVVHYKTGLVLILGFVPVPTY